MPAKLAAVKSQDEEKIFLRDSLMQWRLFQDFKKCVGSETFFHDKAA